MFGSVALEVVLGLAFLFASFSLACSAVVEFVESLRGQRNKQLAAFVERMLGAELKTQFYQHGLIQSLYKAGRLPSYIPSNTFARTLLDLLIVDAAQFRQQLEAAPGELGRTLRALIRDAADLEQAQTRIEHWFECAMDRCSGVYSRRTRWVAFASGLVVAALLNIDTLEIASALYSDSHLRLSIVAQADAEGQVPIGRRTADGRFSVLEIPIENGTLPLGWENSRLAARAGLVDRTWSQPAFWLGPLLSKILGLIVTALAGAIGAGIWFDAWTRLAALRSSVVPRGKGIESLRKSH